MIKSFVFRIFPLIISLLIYVFYRSEFTLINHFFRFFIPWIDWIKWQNEIQASLPLPNWVVYSLPEGLWVLFVTLISKEIYFSQKSKNYSLVFLPLCLAISIEALQFLQLTDGTFDWIDLTAALLFWSIGCFVLPPRFNPVELKKVQPSKGFILIGSYLMVILSDVF